MQRVLEVMALAGQGLEGDRYCNGSGSWNKKTGIGNRQVTLINGRLVAGTPFSYADTRRNIVTDGVELMWLIGREFKIGDAIMHGVKYCDPCNRPSTLSGKKGFESAFHDIGGLVAEIVTSGLIHFESPIIPPSKDF